MQEPSVFAELSLSKVTSFKASLRKGQGRTLLLLAAVMRLYAGFSRQEFTCKQLIVKFILWVQCYTVQVKGMHTKHFSPIHLFTFFMDFCTLPQRIRTNENIVTWQVMWNFSIHWKFRAVWNLLTNHHIQHFHWIYSSSCHFKLFNVGKFLHTGTSYKISANANKLRHRKESL